MNRSGGQRQASLSRSSNKIVTICYATMGFNAIIGCVFFHSPLPVSHRRSAGALFGVVAAFLLLTGCQSADPTKKPDSPTSQVVVACINTSEADLRFNDVDELVSAHSYSAARSILEVLLTDCAEKVRNKALDSLTCRRWLIHWRDARRRRRHRLQGGTRYRPSSFALFSYRRFTGRVG